MTEQKKKLSPEQYRERVSEGNLYRELVIRFPRDMNASALVHNLVDTPMTHDDLYRFAQAVVMATSPEDTQKEAKLAKASALAEKIAATNGYNIADFLRYNRHLKIPALPTTITWKQAYLAAESVCTPQEKPVYERTLRDSLVRGLHALPTIAPQPVVMHPASPPLDPFKQLSIAAVAFEQVLQTAQGMINSERMSIDSVPTDLRHFSMEKQQEIIRNRDTNMPRLNGLSTIVLEAQKMSRHFARLDRHAIQDLYREGHGQLREAAQHISLEQRAIILTNTMRTATDLLRPKTLLNGDLVAEISRVGDAMQLLAQCVELDRSPDSWQKAGPMIGHGIRDRKDITRGVRMVERSRLQEGAAAAERAAERAAAERAQKHPNEIIAPEKKSLDQRIYDTMSQPLRDVEKLLGDIASYQKAFGKPAGQGRG